MCLYSLGSAERVSEGNPLFYFGSSHGTWLLFKSLFRNATWEGLASLAEKRMHYSFPQHAVF